MSLPQRRQGTHRSPSSFQQLWSFPPIHGSALNVRQWPLRGHSREYSPSCSMSGKNPMAVCRAVRAFLTLLLFVQAGYACYPQNLLLCWDMQEGQLTRVKDSVKGVDGAMTGTVAWVPGQQPRGLNEFPTSASSNTFVNTGEWM